MIKKIVLSGLLLTVIFILGCTGISDLTKDLTESSSTTGLKILRAATLESKWAMKQMEIEVGADEEMEVLLKLADQDEVDGYFYLESGSITDFQITGKLLIYSAQAQGMTEPEGISSARFSFVASQAQGTTYTLTFSNAGDDSNTRTKQTIFLEVIYPINGSLFIPVETD